MLKIGDLVEVSKGTQSRLRERGYVADYMKTSVDGKIGVVVEDYRHIAEFPHLAVELGFDYPVGIAEADLAKLDKIAIDKFKK